jgi:acyl transferase domain-containing protein/NADPH-dependent curcumin reductase CurA/acyl carrier protein
MQRRPDGNRQPSDRSSPLKTGNSPLSIVGLGCRLPGGVECWQDYWQLLEQGRDAIEETPASRWNLQKFYTSEPRPGKTHSRWGGYVKAIEQFDPQLFGISPREAAGMDPQQRMLLEVAWRALEDAGQSIESVAGEQVAVFVGISSFDYAVAGLSSDDRGVIDAYSNTGGSSSIAANRISYCFDLRGPSVAVDTACSSSLVAVHMACESLWNGDSKLALAGGVNALLMPDFYVAFSQLGVLSPDGRCKAFDARANGYVRSEGAGMVLIKPLADAMRDGDCIYAVIRSTALNQDGRTPGLTVPSQEAQETLVQTACRRAGIAPSAIQYVEAHGTGTPVGDPIEARALAAVLGQGRVHVDPCWIGSVKTNIGHLEAGAGMASLIKVALSLHHEMIPAHLHFQSANPAIDFAKFGLRIPVTNQPWQRDPSRPRLAGINGFGYGGANAHIIVEEAPVAPKQVLTNNSRKPFQPADRLSGSTEKKVAETRYQLPVVLPISARSIPALTELARNWSEWLETNGGELQLAEVASFVAHRRSHLEVRGTVCGTTPEEWIEQLLHLADGKTKPTNASPQSLNIAFVCSGQGPQWWAMGRNLLRYCPAFRDVIERCGHEFSKFGDWSLLEEFTRAESVSKMQRTHIAQPSIFALQVGLASVWSSWGIHPSLVVGHSVGEIAGAYIAGALTFEEACAVAFHRGRTMELATSRGAMLAAGLSPDELRRWVGDIEKEVSVAAVNGPASITVSGTNVAINRLFERLSNAKIFCRKLKVEYAFHSPQMDPVRDELLRSLRHLNPQPTHTELISTVTGQSIDGRDLDAEYWWQNVRQSVLFADAMRCLASRDSQVAVELGAHPVLAYSIAECFQAEGKTIRTLPSLHRDKDDLRTMATSLGELYCLGAKVQWSGFYTKPTRKLTTPTYPFQRTNCWSESRQTRLSRLGAVAHPLLGESQYGPEPRWHGRIDLRLQSFLSDHRVRGTSVYPAAAIIESALCAARIVQESNHVQLDRLRLLSPLVLSEGRPQWIETQYRRDRRQLEMHFRATDDDQWIPMMSSQVSSLHRDDIDLCQYPNEYQETFDGQRMYAYCKQLGLEYGPQFRGVVHGSRFQGSAWIDVVLAKKLQPESIDYQLHPALLDACFHGMIAADRDFDHTLGGLYLPAQIQQIRFFRRPSEHVRVHINLVSKNAKRMFADIDIYDCNNELCVSLKGFESHRVHGGGKPAETVKDLVYKYAWQPQHLPKQTNDQHSEKSHWIVFAGPGPLSSRFVDRITELGHTVSVVQPSDLSRANVGSGGLRNTFIINPESLADFKQLLQSTCRSKRLTNIVYLWAAELKPATHMTTPQLDRSTILTTLAPMHLVQAWEGVCSDLSANLALVTCGAQSIDSYIEPVVVAQAPLIGFGRVMASEYAALRTKLIDLQNVSSVDELVAETLAAVGNNDGDEDEILWRDRQRWVHRFVQAEALPLPADVSSQIDCQLQVGKTAGVEELKYQTTRQSELAGNQVEIEVLATGLNFSDVMKALELYPGLPDGPIALGAECSGRILRVGSDVTEFLPGDEVIAVAPGSFATRVTVSEELVAKKPGGISHDQAAGIPIAFLTADYALNHCARLRSGESVLIHAASGGVGLAAMQIAKHIGATIFATAGNEEKRAFVRQHGASYVMDSRNLNFLDEILETTQASEQPGVDVVLNSLPGEAIAKGIAALRLGGRFLEIGKRDIYNDAALGLLPFQNNLSFHAIDLDQLFQRQPKLMGQMLRRIVDQFEKGELQPVFTKSYAAEDTRSAFKFMQQGRHIGKVVVDYTTPPTELFPGEFGPIRFRRDATYWVAGGLGGFGTQVARWLADRGAGNLVLSGRSHLTPEKANEISQDLTKRGAQVCFLPTDITRLSDVERTLEIIKKSSPGLAGVFHTAMVLEDKLLVDLDRTTLEKVIRPKVLGGWNLHQATEQLDLDCFVMFSSLSSVFGHAGQANYSAANAFLDGLVHYRRAKGLTALAINWGHLGEVGYLAEREQLGQRLERQGVLSFTVKQALECLEYAMQLNELQISVLRMDWSLWRGLGITSRVSRRFAHLLINQTGDDPSDQTHLANAEQLRKSSATTRTQLVERLLRHKAGSLLGIASEHIQRERALLELGLDSLMAVEMRNWIETQMEISLPIASLMRSASLVELVNTICQIIGDSSEGELTKGPSLTKSLAPGMVNKNVPSDFTARQASELLDQLPSMGDAEVAEMLARMLDESPR